ncbi:hypothetical protein F4806DRAFT_507960 [Annulohypoxylon nitens]|nr:hypothetical protein F4806DRAFT_507960 [Annulohypoxylon nitens]
MEGIADTRDRNNAYQEQRTPARQLPPSDWYARNLRGAAHAALTNPAFVARPSFSPLSPLSSPAVGFGVAPPFASPAAAAAAASAALLPQYDGLPSPPCIQRPAATPAVAPVPAAAPVVLPPTFAAPVPAANNAPVFAVPPALSAATRVTCPDCGKSFATARTLMCHRKTIHIGTHCRWGHCHQHFATPDQLTAHLMEHQEQAAAALVMAALAVGDVPRPFVCGFPGCGREIRDKSELSRHIRIHNSNAAGI